MYRPPITRGMSIARACLLAILTLLVPLLGLTAAPVAQAASLTVTSTATSGAGSLRQAIADAASGDTINFNLSGCPCTITLASELVIGKNLTISGPGAGQLTISGNSAVRVFFINPGAAGATTGPPATNPTVTITDLTVANGRGIGGAGAAGGGSGGGAAGMGGGLFVNGGSVTLARVVFANHQAIGGGSRRGGSGSGGSGGGGGGFGGAASSDNGAGGGALGGNGGSAAFRANGGPGGDGGGGGGGGCCDGELGGAGGFGGGGGGGAAFGLSTGGNGGFGSGGGGGGGNESSSAGGSAGRFGGAGGNGGFFNDAGGGGGAGLGGAVFVRAGATLLNQVVFNTNSTTGGTGGINKDENGQAASGQGKGGALFICTAAEDASCSATVRGSGVTFSGNSAPDDANSTTDNDNVYGTITPATLTTPSVTINQGANQDDQTDVSPIVFDVRFSESVTGFDGNDVQLSGTAGATTASVSGSGSSYTLSVSGMTQSGTVIANIAAGAALNAAGNFSTAATFTDNTVTFIANRPPTATNDSYSTNEDTTLTVNAPGVLGNDSDPNSDPLTAVKVSDPAHGTLTFNANGSFTYTPAANYNGSDSFTYKVYDGTVDSNVATVNITVNAVNDAPTATNDSYSTSEDTVLVIFATTPGVLGNDIDAEGDPLTAVKVSDPAHGTLTFNANGSFTYTPNANYNGPDSFTYMVNDGTVNSNVATVSLMVNAVNDAPSAANDSYSTNEDTALTISAPGVLANDSDIDGNALTAVTVSNPAHGMLTLNANGGFTYTPAANYNGPDSFTYKANDGTADSNVATVSLTVNAVNDAPTVAVGAGGACLADSRGQASLTLGDVETAAGSLTLSASSSNTTLVPNGNITFGGSGANRTVTIATASGRSGSATVTITVSDGATTATTTITVIAGTNQDDMLNGTSGADMLFGGNSQDTLTGNGGNDLLCGGRADDELIGGDGADTLDSGQGQDDLYGGAGDDRLTGGSGSDRFDGGPGNDTATDFTSSQGDTQTNIP